MLESSIAHITHPYTQHTLHTHRERERARERAREREREHEWCSFFKNFCSNPQLARDFGTRV